MSQSSFHDIRDQYYLRNTFGISSSEIFWGLGLPLVIESTFLQLFMRNLGASSFLIGLIPTFYCAGIAIFSLLSGYLTAHLVNKRNAVIIAHLSAALPIFIFGIYLYFIESDTYIVFIFFLLYALFSIGIGLTLPVWQNYLVKIFSEQKTFSALSVMRITQSVARLLSSVLIVKFVNRYSFSTKGTGFIFIIFGFSCIIGSFGFLFTREIDNSGKQNNKYSSPFDHFFYSIKEVLHNKDFLFFLVNDLELCAITGVISFYANYATEYCNVSPAIAAGLFGALNYIGGIGINILMGLMGFFNIKNKFIISKISSILAILMLVLFESTWSFLLASFLLGVSRAIRMLAYPPAVKKLSGMSDATNYFAVAPLLVLPVSAGIPLLNGKFLDYFSFLGSYSYKIVFIAMGFLITLSLLFIYKTDFSGSNTKNKTNCVSD